MEHPVEPVEPGFEPAQRLLDRFLEIAADRHDLADRFHRGRKQRFRTLELLEGETRDLGHHVIDRRLEAGGRRPGDLVGDLIQRIADRQLGGDPGDRKAGGLGSQRRRTRHARVHLDHDQAAVLGIDRELDVRPAGFHPDLAQYGDRGRAHDLVFLVGQRQRRRDRDRIPGVYAHRIDVLDRADDDGIVVAVAHDFHLVLFPAEQAFLDQNLSGWRGIEAGPDNLLELGLVVGHPPAGAAQGKAGPDDCRQAGAFEHREGLVNRMGHTAARAFEADLVHRLAEALAVFGLVDRIGIGADHLDPVLLQRAIVEQRQRGVERGLPAHRRQDGIGPLLLDDPRDHIGGDRLDIGGIGHVRIGHDRGGVGVDQHHPVPLLLQRLDRLGSGVVELAGLADNNRTGANDEDRGDVSAFGHL